MGVIRGGGAQVRTGVSSGRFPLFSCSTDDFKMLDFSLTFLVATATNTNRGVLVSLPNGDTDSNKNYRGSITEDF